MRFAVISLALVIGWTAFAQTYTVSTIAGGYLPENVLAASAGLYGPQSVAVDPAGSLFFSDSNAHVILRWTAANGVLTVVAGNGTGGFSGDGGPATNAQLDQPMGVALDSSGNLYIADTDNSRIRKVANGVITTVVGGLSDPTGVALDSAGNLYIAELANNRVRMVSNGVITTVAGTGVEGFSGDGGPATSAQLNLPENVALDASGNLYIADTGNGRIRKVANGVITTVAGSGTSGSTTVIGTVTTITLNTPSGIAVDSAGNLYIASEQRVLKVANGVAAVVAGTGTQGFSGDNGPAASAQLNSPEGIAIDSAGNLYIADYLNRRIRKVANGAITTLAGSGSIGDNGAATSAQLQFPWGVAAEPVGNLYIADSFNSLVRKISNGVITTLAGGGASFGDGGPATNAQLAAPEGVAVDSTGNVYIADTFYNRVRKVTNGVITTVAGSGHQTYSGDNGPATSAGTSPTGVAVDSAGNLYIADSFNYRVRKVTNGIISTVAGNGSPGFSGDNGPATAAGVSPDGVAVDSAGNLFIADFSNNRIRKVSNGVITTVAGNGTPGFSGDNGPATSAQIGYPQGIWLDPAGNLYIADNDRIRKVTNGMISTIAGNGRSVFGGDNGPAISAELNQTRGVTLDSAGNIYIADTYNNRVRMLTPNAAVGGAIPAIDSTLGVQNQNSAPSTPGVAVAPGSLVAIYGTNFATATTTALSLPLPTTLANITVSFNGVDAPIVAIASAVKIGSKTVDQINAIVPWELTPGTASVVVTNNGVPSSPVNIPIAASGPGIFYIATDSSGVNRPLVYNNSDGTFAYPSGIFGTALNTRPASIANDIIAIWCTGLGPVTGTPPDGAPALDAFGQFIESDTISKPVVLVGGQQADVLFSGLAQFPSIYQINVKLNPATPTGNAVPIQVRLSGGPLTTDRLQIAVTH